MTTPADAPAGYYGGPVLKGPVWRWPVPTYFFTGGLAAGSSLLAEAAHYGGRAALARRSRITAAAAIGASAGLLVSDLGHPSRFANMLRVARPSSPMSVGSWLLAVYGPATAAGSALDIVGCLPRVARAAQVTSAALAPAVATYTAVLVSDTAVPAWHEARGELPFVFAGSAAAAAGGLAAAFARGESALARRVGIGGGVTELLAGRLMLRRLGPLGSVYGEGWPRRLRGAAEALTVAGCVAQIGGSRGRHRSRLAAGGGAMLVAGALLERFAVFRAGVASAADPEATIGPQRARLEARPA